MNRPDRQPALLIPFSTSYFPLLSLLVVTGLNIFNTALILAKPSTATDVDYHRIDGVVAHEYFHNWTGNRVTCRDWFQLTLKEGKTLFLSH